MQEKKLTSRQAQAIKTRNKIYNTAYDLMEKKGFNNITIEDISKKAGVSVGAFYHYFHSKNDILFEIYRRADDYFRDEVIENLTMDHAADRIVAYFKYYASYSVRTGSEFTKHLYNTDNKFFLTKGRFMQTSLSDLILEGQEKNQISKDMSSEEITELLFITARGVIFDWCLHEGGYDLDQKMVTVMKLLVKSLALD